LEKLPLTAAASQHLGILANVGHSPGCQNKLSLSFPLALEDIGRLYK